MSNVLKLDIRVDNNRIMLYTGRDRYFGQGQSKLKTTG